MVQDSSKKESESYSNNENDLYKSNIFNTSDLIDNGVRKLLFIFYLIVIEFIEILFSNFRQ